MEYRVLGPFEVGRGEGDDLALGSFKQRALLALLLIHANEVVSTDRIIDELWGADVPTDRQNALWVHVSKLRSLLEPDRSPRSEGTVLLTRPPGYVLRVEEGEVDAWRFQRLVDEGRTLLDVDPAAASMAIAEGLSLWRGRPYAELTYESFAQAEIARLEERRLDAVEGRVEADLRRGLTSELVGELESLVRQHPLREGLTAQLMLALYRSGRQADALRAYARLRTQLAEELGIEASAALTRLEEQIVLGDTSLDAPSFTAGPHARLAVRGYELREEIGAGGLGITYRAYQPAVGREVAVTVVASEVANEPAFVRRFEAEAEIVARLEHPHIAPVYDFWREPDAAYVVTRLFRGGTLADAIRTRPLTAGDAAQVAQDVASALASAHRNGVAHRGIDARCIVLDDERRAYLTDFGLGDDDFRPAADIADLARVLAGALSGDALTAARPVLDRAPDYADAAAFAGALGDALHAPPPVDEPGVLTNPYKGLRAFDEGDALDFFGRERLVERLVARLGDAGARGRFLAVVGASGSGKSSAVKAGLVPALRQGALPGSAQWFIVDVAPGAHPFEALEAALLRVAVNPPPSLLEELSTGASGIDRVARRILPDDGSQLLVVIDQFEELYTHARPEAARAFLDALAAAVSDPSSRVRVVVTLRADFYDRPLRHRAVGELFRRGTEVVTAMSPDELARAVTGPAERVGVRVEPGVVAAVVADVAERAGALPLLQYALTELFDRRRGRTIGLAVYREAGGAAGALVRRAEALYAEFDGVTREATRQVLLRLVTVGEGTDVFRRRVARRELGALEHRAVGIAVDTLGRHRLLSFDRDPVTREPTVEIAHEALLVEWSRLPRAWIDESRDDVRQHRRLTASAAEWVAADEDGELLARGSRLDQLVAWAASTGLVLNPTERRFLDASVALRDEEHAAEAERRGREARLRHANERRARQLVGGAVVLALLAVVAGLALVQRADADRQSDERAAVLEAVRLATASTNVSNDDPELATLLALASLRTSASAGIPALVEAEEALHWAIQARHLTYPSDDAPVETRIGPNGVTGIYRLPLTELVGLASRDLDRTLTAEECSTYDLAPCPGRTTAVPEEPARRPPAPTGPQPLAGTSVTMFGVEAAHLGLADELAAFESRTGIDVRFPSLSGGDATSLSSELEPDVFAVQPSSIQELAREGQLVDLGAYLDVTDARRSFGDYLTDAASVGSGWYAVPLHSNLKGLIWYPAAEFEAAGYARPRSWPELLALSEQMIADGRTPWCMGLESAEYTGWPATDWVEALLLRTAGVEEYDRWASHDIPFDDPTVRTAMDRFGEVAFGPGFVRGGPQVAVQLEPISAAFPMVSDPPGCWLFHQASFVLHDLPVGTRFGTDIDYFPMPAMEPGGEAPLFGGASLLGAVVDRPEVRELLRAVMQPDWGQVWASHPASDFLPANARFDSSHCVDPDADAPANDMRMRLCEESQAALASGLWRFDASDRMPVEIGLVDEAGQRGAFLQGMVDYFEQGPDSLDSILAGIESSWAALESD